MSRSAVHRLRVSGASELAQAAASLTQPYTWSPILDIPDLALQTPRLNPVASLDYLTHSSSIQNWYWTSKGCWDPVTERMYITTAPHDGAFTNVYATILSVYFSRENRWLGFEDPFGAVLPHGYDNQCIDPVRRRLYKHVMQKQPPTSIADATIRTIDLDRVNLAITSARASGARAETIPSPIASNQTAGAMDYLPPTAVYPQGALLWHRQARLEAYNFATGAWALIATLTPEDPALDTLTFHNLCHWNPAAGAMVFGGGSNVAGPFYSRSFWKYTAANGVQRIARPPVVMSAGSAAGGDGSVSKTRFVNDPVAADELSFHSDGNVYRYHHLTNTWSIVAQFPSGWSAEAGWATTIPGPRCVMLNRYEDFGRSSVRLFRGA